MSLRAFPWVILAALLSGSLTEKLVFQGNPVPHYGFDVDDDPTHETCPAPYDSETCILIQRSEFSNDYLAKTLQNDKHAYRVHFQIYASADSAQSKFRVVLSFKPGPATPDAEGDGYSTGAFGEAVGAVFEENSVGYDIKLIEITAESYQEIAVGSEPRDSSAWRAYDFIANSDTQDVRLLNDAGDVLVHAPMQHHQGKPFASQWYRGTGGNFYPSNLFLRATNGSPTIYDQDPRPPVISNFTQNPRQVDKDATVQVTATIRDDWGQATAVLRSWVNGQPQSDEAMTHTGTTYHGTLAGQPLGAVVDYYVEATAASGLTARTDTIRYKVGSGKDPENLGGGTGSASSSLGWLGAALIGLGLVAVGFMLNLALKQEDPKLGKWLLVGFAAAGFAAFLVVLNLPAIEQAASNPLLLPALVGAAALTTTAVVLSRKAKEVPK